MTDNLLITCSLALIACCAVLLTWSSILTARSLCRTSARLELLLSHGDDAVQEARRTLGNARQLLMSTGRAAAHVEGTLGRVSGFIQNLFGRFGQTHGVRIGNHRIPRHVTKANKRRLG